MYIVTEHSYCVKLMQEDHKFTLDLGKFIESVAAGGSIPSTTKSV